MASELLAVFRRIWVPITQTCFKPTITIPDVAEPQNLLFQGMPMPTRVLGPYYPGGVLEEVGICWARLRQLSLFSPGDC